MSHFYTLNILKHYEMKYDIPKDKLKDVDIIQYELFKNKNKVYNMSLKQRQQININYIAMESKKSIVSDKMYLVPDDYNVNF